MYKKRKLVNTIFVNSRRIFMTEKELLYIEDSINHLQCFKNKTERYESMIEDENIKNFVCMIKQKQAELSSSFFNLL